MFQNDKFGNDPRKSVKVCMDGAIIPSDTNCSLHSNTIHYACYMHGICVKGVVLGTALVKDVFRNDPLGLSKIEVTKRIQHFINIYTSTLYFNFDILCIDMTI